MTVQDPANLVLSQFDNEGLSLRAKRSNLGGGHEDEGGSIMSYNGWTNYETWTVNKWLTSENPEVANSVYALVQDAGSTATLEEALRKYVGQYFIPALDPGLARDLLQAAVEKVSWQELAERYWREMRQAAKE
jgi:hypothetical protein